MQTSRRLFLETAMQLAALAALPLKTWANGQRRAPTPIPLPTVPNPNPSDDEGAKLDPKKVMEADQDRMKKNVDKLFSLARELKDQKDKTDTTTVLPLDLVHKAAEIEKQAKEIETLAHQIQKLAVAG